MIAYVLRLTATGARGQTIRLGRWRPGGRVDAPVVRVLGVEASGRPVGIRRSMENPLGMESRSDRTARQLATRIEELASALHRAGAPVEASARLLELASLATMHAVSLDSFPPRRTVAAAAEPIAEPVRLRSAA